MRRSLQIDQLARIALASAALMFGACGDAELGSNEAALAADPSTASASAHSVALCEHNDTPGYAHCHARVRSDENGVMQFAAAPTGLGPSDLISAYKIPTTSGNGKGKIVAIVDAMDDPNAESDLAVYRSQYGLPPCTTANGCFQKVNQSGQPSPLPTADSGWSGESSLDLDMVSAGCPDCKILLVEATSASMADLGAAELMAVSMGAAAVSNSFGGAEDNTIAGTDAMYFSHPGVGIFVSSGDSGYGAEYPASSQYVTAVGGTTLTKDSSARGWTEKAWGNGILSKLLGGGGSGCSKYITKPSWQKDKGCSMRTVADIALNADPVSGPAIYDTYGSLKGWTVVGGTSAASPLAAAIYTETGNAGAGPSLSYTKTSEFYDVTTGSNGACGTYLCKGGVGYDGPTGNGSPNASAM
jgi:subtilase family serine protease